MIFMIYSINNIPSISQPVERLSSVSDVATLLDSYEQSLNECHYSEICDVRQIGDKYVIITKKGTTSDFDFFEFLNSRYRGSCKINCMNARLMFPKRLSRGIYTGSEYEDSDFSDDSPTGFIGDLDMEKKGAKGYKILYEKLGILLEIPESGLILGRSSQKADFRIRDNSDVSRRHCKLYRKGSDMYVQDLSSLNGTFVDGNPVPVGSGVLLRSGNVISVAGELFKVK